MDKEKILSSEIRAFWKSYFILMLKWNLRSFFAVVSTAVIWDFISKNYLGSKVWYSSMNDTEDGDYGAEWWLEEKGLTPSLYSAFLWWLRNHSWNYIRQFEPPWYGGEVESFLNIKDTLSRKDDYGRFTRADKTRKIYGTHHIAYRIDGKVFCQWSYANRIFHLQLGTGGSEYRFRMNVL